MDNDKYELTLLFGIECGSDTKGILVSMLLYNLNNFNSL